MSLNIEKIYLLALMLALALINTILASKLSRKAKYRFKKNSKKYLLEEIIFRVGAFSSVLNFSNLFHLSSFLKSSDSVYFKTFVAALITLTIIYSYISLIVIPQKAEELLEETYPEYKVS